MSKHTSHNRPLRVVQWATGTVGTSALRGIIQHPDLELVGVRVYSDAKAGKDAGDLCGLAPVGIAATQVVPSLLATRPDCVVYMPDRTDVDELCGILASGANVVTTRADFFNPAMMAPELRERVEAACREGNSSLHATGSSPGFVTEALIPPLLSLQRNLDLLTIDEFADCVDTCSDDMLLNIMGFGAPPQVFERTEFTERDTTFGHSLGVVAAAIGLPFDHVEVSSEFAVARSPVQLRETVIDAGTVGGQRHTVTGFCSGRPVLRFRSNWYVTTDLDKAWALRDDGWQITVEGDTPVELTMRFPIGSDPVTRAAIMPNVTAHRPINSIAAVCAAPAGIVTSATLPQIFARLGPAPRR
ncbi:NAD(P)H-dependent amine dehydrogenase family protein [Novosphingobium aerophilum]|uniref:Dihydrodipicolinate reductase n=1 Tax=Novosphingobium aerophilum TaxID=2839843 RepID=A0A7X1F5U9_9SPHN|nr:dihydrodipicolinate reductase [Novosphingobium aerophilum]MBC2650925.1 dihydrodipicolinate reductase [Novosphingobium aerophilum]